MITTIILGVKLKTLSRTEPLLQCTTAYFVLCACPSAHKYFRSTLVFYARDSINCSMTICASILRQRYEIQQNTQTAYWPRLRSLFFLHCVGATIKLVKLNFITNTIKYDCNFFRPRGLELESQTTDAIQHFEPPASLKNLRMILCVPNILKRFVLNALCRNFYCANMAADVAYGESTYLNYSETTQSIVSSVYFSWHPNVYTH